MKKNLLLLCILFTALLSSAQAPTDLFFSEYVEGSGNNKALEIYNPTNQTINLNNYYVARFSNGSSVFTEGGYTHLVGSIAPYKTFILVNGQVIGTSSSPVCSPELQAMATQLDGAYPAPTYMNGNDAMALIKTPGGVKPLADMTNVTPVDLIGQIGLGNLISAETGWSDAKDATLSYKNATTGATVTGQVINYIVQAKATDGATFGPYWMSWTSDHSLFRKPGVTKGVSANPIPFIVSSEWDTVPGKRDALTGKWVNKDIWDHLGYHYSVADPSYHVAVKAIDAQSVLTIYPNPVTEQRFTIQSHLPVKAVKIFSVIGQPIYNEQFSSPRQETEVFTGHLGRGIYMVKVIYTDNNSVVQRILVK